MFLVGSKNLAANNWRLPTPLKGMQGNAVCQGVFNFNHSSVACDITSLTFIFTNGTIVTANAKKGTPFGHLTTHYGNSYIPGKYYGNAFFGAVGTGVFSGIQGFGNAFAAGQMETQTLGSSSTVINSFKNSYKYGEGQAMGSSGEALNKWWLQTMKSMTNYVVAQNWDPKTHKILQLNAKITRTIPIDFNKKSRMVNYENKDTTAVNNSLD